MGRGTTNKFLAMQLNILAIAHENTQSLPRHAVMAPVACAWSERHFGALQHPLNQNTSLCSFEYMALCKWRSLPRFSSHHVLGIEHTHHHFSMRVHHDCHFNFILFV